MDYDAIVFDNDGVLARITEGEAVRNAIRQTFHEFGVQDPDPAHIEQLFGVTMADLLSVCSTYDLDPGRFWKRRDQNVAAAQIRLINAGTKDLYEDVAVLDAITGPLGVVSNNQHRTVQYILSHYGLIDQFNTVYGRRPTLEDVMRKKPNPYYIEQAMTDLSATDALYVGDSPKDVIAAQRAGIDAAFIRRSHRKSAELPVKPTIEVPDLTTLVAEITG